MKRKILLIAFLSIFLFSSLAYAEEWQRTEMNPGSDYNEAYSVKGCVIGLNNSGQSIDIIAFDFDTNICQIIRIDEVGKKQFWFRTKRAGDAISLGEKLDQSADVFAEKYLEYAKTLPDEVKQKFRGQYPL